MGFPFQRILIIGCSGSGKSTLSRKLGEILDLPVIHLDREYFHADWIPRPDEEFDRIVHRLVSADRWIVDGNFSRTLPVRLVRADMVIHLDFPRWRCVRGVVQRWIGACLFDAPRPDMADGCNEKLDWEFLEWVWNFRDHSRPKVLEQLARWNGPLTTLTSIREIEHWLDAASLSGRLADTKRTKDLHESPPS